MQLKNVEIVKIGELREFESGFKVVEFVVKTDDEYPQFLTVQSIKEKADNLLKYNKVGDRVDLSINLRGRKYENDGVVKYFNSIEAWAVFKAESQEQPEPQNQPEIIEQNDDLPF